MYNIYRMDNQDRGAKICWFLNELGVPFTLEYLEHEKFHFDPDFRKKHPLGLVPVLYDVKQDFHMFESSAILLYLAKKHPNSLVADWNGVHFAKIMQWFAYNNCTLEPGYEQYFALNDPKNDPNTSAIETSILKILGPIEAQLLSTPYITGHEFTLADLALSQTLFWMTRLPLMAGFPKIGNYLASNMQRPAAIKTGLFHRKEVLGG